MSIKILNPVNWTVFGQGNHCEVSKKLHEWFGKFSLFVKTLTDRVIQLEDKDTHNLEQIRKLKSDLETANKAVKPSNISTNWVQVVTKGSINPRKPAEQKAVANAMICELN